MGFRFRRSVKLFPGLRLNFGKRGISASIGVRDAHVTYGPTGTRTTVGLPGSGLSYTHFDKPHRDVLIPAAAEPPTDPAGRQGSTWRGFWWTGLIVTVLIIAFDRLTTPPPPMQLPTPPRTLAQAAAQTAAQAVDNERVAEIKRAALGVTQIRHVVANSNTLRLSQVTMMPKGTICYQLHLQNSRGVAYVRTAVIDGTVLSISGSGGFSALWNRHCAHQSDGRDITAEVENAIQIATR